ncbi:MAG: TRAP transporter large permease [Spirochaetia bacterium]|nr:TRAP transporter large permease [Spirochaetia bacterium]
MTSVILFGGFILFSMLSVPIGISLGLAVMGTIFYSGIVDITFFAQGLTTAMDSFPLMAAVFFILAGDLMGKGGISKRLLKVADVFFGHHTGGLALVTVVACMFFAAISGTGSATVAAIGTMVIPEMTKKNYDKGFSSALIASSGSIGAMIPPSITMVIYGVTAGVSITAIFLAGILPGILVGISLMIYSYIISKKNDYKGEDKRYSFKEKLSVINEAKWSLLVPVIILGGIYGGIFTPTEAAAVAVIYGYIIGVFVYKEIKLVELPDVILRSGLITATVLVIIGTSAGFGRILTLERIPELIANFIVGVSSNKYIIFILINLLLLAVGTFMETLAAVIILTPILLPIVTALGMSPVQFGIIMVINLAIGFVTPPLGANLFVSCQISGVSFERISRSIVPFILVMVTALMLITFIPEISMFLPNLLMK